MGICGIADCASEAVTEKPVGTLVSAELSVVVLVGLCASHEPDGTAVPVDSLPAHGQGPFTGSDAPVVNPGAVHQSV